MIFHRSTPPRVYKQYKNYQSQLRKDFCNRCAYCFRHEKHFGGVGNGQIDHFLPETLCLSTGQNELVYAYTNLFWACAECNGSKHESWPNPEEEALGFRFVDPTKENTHNHWTFQSDGQLKPLSNAGRYTIEEIVLWRDDLVRWRRETYDALQRVERLKTKLQNPSLSAQDKEDFHMELREKILNLYPMPISRPKKKRSFRF